MRLIPIFRQTSSTPLYAQKYPDHWKAELVLFAHAEERASSLSHVIAEWQKVNRSVPLVVRALDAACRRPAS